MYACKFSCLLVFGLVRYWSSLGRRSGRRPNKIIMYACKFLCLLVFGLVRYWSSIGRRSGRRRTWQNCEIPYYKYYIGFSRFCRLFFNIISFQHVLHFDVGRSQIDWNVKVKGQILICTGSTFYIGVAMVI